MAEKSLSTNKLNSELWNKFKEGDRNAFQKLYQNYLHELFNYGAKITPIRSLVIDSIQDLFIDLWQHRANLSSTENLKFYLFKALRRRIVKELNKERKFLVGLDQTLPKDYPIVLPLENKIIEGQENKERLAKLHKAISKLSDRQREVINLIFYEGFSYEETSSLIGINLRSTYTLAWKALAVLRKELVKFIILPFLLLFS